MLALVMANQLDPAKQVQRCSHSDHWEAYPVFPSAGGRYSAETLLVAHAMGLTTTFWTDDPSDFDHPGQRLLEARLSGHLRSGSIVLLHDDVVETLRVLPHFVKYAARRRIRLVTVGELAEWS